MLEAVWSRTVRAACPAHAVLLTGTTRVALGYRDPEGEHQLVCHSLSGELVYSRSSVTPLALVERDRLLIRREPKGDLELLDARGVVVRRLDLGTPTRSARVEDGCIVLVADGLRVIATFDLEILHRVPWSEGWCGSEAGHYRRCLQNVVRWSEDESDPHVRRWLEDRIDYLNRRISNAIDEEEREDY